MKKKCNKCQIEKDLNEFNKHKPSKDGLSYVCKACNKAQLHDYQKSDRGILVNWRSSINKIERLSFSITDLLDRFMADATYRKLYDNWDKKDFYTKPRVMKINKEEAWILSNIKITSDELEQGPKVKEPSKGYKKCSKCKENKLPSYFHNDSSRKDGCSDSCKVCIRNRKNEFQVSKRGILSIWRTDTMKHCTDITYSNSELINRFENDIVFTTLYDKWDKINSHTKPRIRKIRESNNWTLDNIKFVSYLTEKGTEAPTGYKKCSRCLKNKFTATEFSAGTNNKDGLANACSNCHREHGRTKIGKISIMYHGQLGRSKQRKHYPPMYTRDELYRWILKQPNFNKLWRDWVFSNYETDLAPSIDRLNDSIGYSFDNIQLVTWLENNTKNAITTRRPVIIKNKLGDVIRTFPTLISCAKYYHVSTATIHHWLNRNQPLPDGTIIVDQ